MANILVVDDEQGIRDLLYEILNDEGHHVELAENAMQARLLCTQSKPDLVLLDIWMPDTDGVTLLKEWAAKGLLSMPVLMMSGHATIETAVEATRIGAIGFLEKPITLQKLLKSVSSGLSSHRFSSRNLGSNIAAATPTALGGQPLVPHGSGTPAHRPPGPTVGNQTASIPLPDAPPTGPVAAPDTSKQSFDLTAPLRVARDSFEKAYFEFHLAREMGSMIRVAEKTGIERTHLYRKLRQLGVDLVRLKKPSA